MSACGWRHVVGVILVSSSMIGSAQTPDNRDIQIDVTDPEMPSEYRDTLEERDRQRLEEAVGEGESYPAVRNGRGRGA